MDPGRALKLAGVLLDELLQIALHRLEVVLNGCRISTAVDRVPNAPDKLGRRVIEYIAYLSKALRSHGATPCPRC